MGYASTVNGLFSFRMSETVVRFGGEYLERGENEKTAALVKAAGLGEASVSVLAFLFVALTAGLASQFVAKTPGTAWMFAAYGLGLLANFNVETSTGVLQITGHIKQQGVINLIQNVLATLIIVAAYFWAHSLWIVLLAYLLGKIVLGLGVYVMAQVHLRRSLGPGWWKAPFSVLPAFRELFRFAFSSNLSATVIKVFRESEIVWVGFFLSSAAAGYYKVAYNIISLLSVPADPLIMTVYPELNRLVVQKAWPRLRDFLRKVTTLSFAYNMLLVLGLVVLGRWVLLIFGSEYVSFNLPTFPLWAALIAGLLKVGLAFPLVPRYGYVMEGWLLSFYYILSVGLIVWRGMRELRRQESIKREER